LPERLDDRSMRILATAAALMLIAMTALMLAVYMCGADILNMIIEAEE
jgi:hypothetical protein